MSSSIDPQDDAEFDAYVGRYHEMHSAVLTMSGEDPEYFARNKFGVLQDIIARDEKPILDYGCGIGNLTHLLAERERMFTGTIRLRGVLPWPANVHHRRRSTTTSTKYPAALLELLCSRTCCTTFRPGTERT